MVNRHFFMLLCLLLVFISKATTCSLVVIKLILDSCKFGRLRMFQKEVVEETERTSTCLLDPCLVHLVVKYTDCGHILCESRPSEVCAMMGSVGCCDGNVGSCENATRTMSLHTSWSI